MELKIKSESYYGFSLLAKRFSQKPFFLGVNGISGEPIFGGSWKFHSDPALCANEVCDGNSLEDIVIYLLHVRQYHYSGNFLIKESFDTVHKVIRRVFERIASEIVPENPIDLNTAMAAYNLITLFREIIINSFSIFYRINSIDELQENYTSLDRFHSMLCRDFTHGYDNINPAMETLSASCSNLKHCLMDAIRITKHNDLKTLSTEIVTHSNEVTFFDTSNGDADDPFFNEPLREVIFLEDNVDISEYYNSTDIEFDALQRELSNKANVLKTFKIRSENFIINSHTLNNYKKLQKLSRNSEISVSENMEKFNKITKDFTIHYWKRRSNKTELNECFLFKAEETQFIFQFTILVLEYLKNIPKYNPEHEHLLQNFFTEFGNILNSLRFLEIDDAITLKTSAILSKTLDELVTEPSVQCFIQRMPAKIMLVTTRITNYIGMVRKNEEYVSLLENPNIHKYSLTNVKPIEHVNQISKIRIDKWTSILVDSATLDNCNQFYNQDICPVCLCEQQKKDSCFLVCKHSMCSSCTENIIDRNQIPLCPVCRYPICEFLPSGKLEEISEDLLQ